MVRDQKYYTHVPRTCDSQLLNLGLGTSCGLLRPETKSADLSVVTVTRVSCVRSKACLGWKLGTLTAWAVEGQTCACVFSVSAAAGWPVYHFYLCLGVLLQHPISALGG